MMCVFLLTKFKFNIEYITQTATWSGHEYDFWSVVGQRQVSSGETPRGNALHQSTVSGCQ